jgi:BMFP domain-containing protein YqiC
MRKTKDSIERKWAKKLETVRLRAEFKFNVLIENRKKKHNEALEHDIEKLEKKKAAYLNKKEKVYKRGMLNEIREFE